MVISSSAHIDFPEYPVILDTYFRYNYSSEPHWCNQIINPCLTLFIYFVQNSQNILILASCQTLEVSFTEVYYGLNPGYKSL